MVVAVVAVVVVVVVASPAARPTWWVGGDVFCSRAASAFLSLSLSLSISLYGVPCVVAPPRAEAGTRPRCEEDASLMRRGRWRASRIRLESRARLQFNPRAKQRAVLGTTKRRR